MTKASIHELQRIAGELVHQQAKASSLVGDWKRALVLALADLQPRDLVEPVLAEAFGQLGLTARTMVDLVDLYEEILTKALLFMPPQDAAAVLEALNRGKARAQAECTCPTCTAKREKAAAEPPGGPEA